jgi:sugar phosphate isomerase/epimerase
MSVERAAWFVDQVGRPNVGIGVDALHLIRSGGTPADVARLDGRYLSNAQICDGHGLHRASDYMTEARNRELPGAGDFPLRTLLSALPATIPLELEVPSQKRREAGISAIDHVREAMSRLHALVDTEPSDSLEAKVEQPR